MRKKSPYLRTSSSLNMAVRGGLTRCARRYSAHPRASPLRGQRRRCSKLLPAILSGQIPRRLVICPTGCRQLSNPGRGFSSPPPAGAICEKKSPYLRTSSSLNMAVRGGLTRYARRYSAHPRASPLRGQRRRCSKLLPAILSGQIPRRLVICPTGCRQLSNPGRGFSFPPAGAICEKKSPYLRTSSSSNMAVRGGLTRYARPPGRFLAGSSSVQLAGASCRTPVGASHPPPVECNRRKKSPYLRTSSSSNMAVRGGFEPPIRCRIHTFQACSFSHSDTSPYCFAAHLGWATGRYYRELR